MSTLLTCNSVVKTYGPTRAVGDVSFSVNEGSVLALVGENGAGKSTLLNVLSGVVRPDSGSVSFSLADGKFGVPIAMVHQELSLFDNLTVGENLALGLTGVGAENYRAYARESLDAIGVSTDIDRPVHMIPLGERQLVELAKAVALRPAVLVLDEPTSALEPAEVDILFTAVEIFRQSGGAVIFVSHRFEEVFQLCTQVLVLRDGAKVLFDDLESVSQSDLIEAMAGREIEDTIRDLKRGAPTVRSGEPALELRQVRVTPSSVPVDLAVPAGQITAIAGLEGHGQAELAEAAAGIRRVHGGSIMLHGREVVFRSSRAAIGHGVVYVTPDRRKSGIYAGQSVQLNTLVPGSRRIFRCKFVLRKSAERLVAEALAHMSTKYASLRQPINELSGGNQQKIVLGRWLLSAGVAVLVLNDPTRGVDVNAREQIYSMIFELIDAGAAILLISTDLNEVLRLADTTYVIYEGKIRGRLVAGDMTQQSVMTLATGGKIGE